MSDKIPFVFRQNSDFFYLTGCLEPSAVLVMVKPMQTDTYKVMFRCFFMSINIPTYIPCRPHDKKMIVSKAHY